MFMCTHWGMKGESRAEDKRYKIPHDPSRGRHIYEWPNPMLIPFNIDNMSRHKPFVHFYTKKGFDMSLSGAKSCWNNDKKYIAKFKEFPFPPRVGSFCHASLPPLIWSYSSYLFSENIEVNFEKVTECEVVVVVVIPRMLMMKDASEDCLFSLPPLLLLLSLSSFSFPPFLISCFLLLSFFNTTKKKIEHFMIIWDINF